MVDTRILDGCNIVGSVLSLEFVGVLWRPALSRGTFAFLLGFNYTFYILRVYCVLMERRFQWNIEMNWIYDGHNHQEEW